MTWEMVPLGEVATVSWGDTSTTKAAYTESGYTAYSASGPDGLLPYADHSEQGVVLSAIGAQCGKTWLTADRWSCIKNTMWFRARDGRAFTPFLYYATADPAMWPRRGAAQPFVALGDARAVAVPLPPLTTQHKIAAILSAYDDLIENNQRRIRLLEEMAQRIYREWFIDFRYPGHEDAPLVDSELGPAPAGWEIVNLGEISKVHGGTTTTKTSFVPSGYVAYSAAGPDGYLPDYQVDGSGIVVSAVGARCGRTWYATGQWSAIANTLRIHPDAGRATSEWLYFATYGRDGWPKRGAAQPFIAINDVRARVLILPPRQLIAEFTAQARPVLGLVTSRGETILSLRATRDLLLPRLVSGDIDVTDLDIALPDLAA